MVVFTLVLAVPAASGEPGHFLSVKFRFRVFGHLVDQLQPAVRWGLGLAILGASAILVTTLTPSADAPGSTRVCVLCGDYGSSDFALNILLFVPFGLGLGLLARRWSGVFTVIAMTIAIELAQLSLVPGRDATLGDVMANSIGGAVGIALASRWRDFVFPEERMRRILLGSAIAAWLLVDTLTAYSVLPAPTLAQYHGQLARQLGKNPAYPGEIRVAAAGPVTIPDWHMDAAPLRESLRRADWIRLDVAPSGFTEWPASMLRVADASGTPILELGADRHRVVFGIRTGASVLHLRPYHVSLSNVFRRNSFEPVAIQARWRNGEAIVQAQQVDGVAKTAVTFGPASGWRLFMPWTVYSDNGDWERIADAVWMLILGFPLGFWSGVLGLKAAVRGNWKGTAIVTAVLAGGLILPSIAMGSPFPRTNDVIAAAVGVALGAYAAVSLQRRRKKFRARLAYRA